MDARPLFVFPKWSNKVALGVVVVLLTAPAYLGALAAYALNPTTLNVGYEPVQPVPYSHALHVGQLGLDCRYCHNTVEKAGFAAIPPTDTCMNCHSGIWGNSTKLAPMFEAAKSGAAMKWVKVHDLPNYVFFNHSAHVNGGVSCVECHGKVNHMEVVSQVQPLNMGWCLDCHRDPDPKIRPKDQVTSLDWTPGPADKTVVGVFAKKVEFKFQGTPEERAKLATESAQDYVTKLAKEDPSRLQRELGAELRKKFQVQPSTDCVTCHR